jgi:hypothetical protein
LGGLSQKYRLVLDMLSLAIYHDDFRTAAGAVSGEADQNVCFPTFVRSLSGFQFANFVQKA